MKIRWAPKSISDLESIRDDIAEHNPAAANQIAARVCNATNRLGSFPLSGREGRVAGRRELVVSGAPYLAVYKNTG
jgi:toxin ParE1/3/4